MSSRNQDLNKYGIGSKYNLEILRRPKNFSSEVEIMLLVVETRSDIRGEIARTYMYMYSVYPGRGIISKKIGNFLMHGIKVTL